MAAAHRTKPARPNRVYAYLRVSTDQQELDAQKLGVVDYAAARKLRIDQWVTETVSGAVAAAERELGKLLPKLGQGDALVVPELSRLGRSTVDVLTTLKTFRDRGVAVHVVKGAFVLGDDINSRILSTVLGLAAEIERELLQQRVKEGLARARANGKHIGRPRIEREEDRRSKLDKHEAKIKEYAALGVNKSNLARIFSCDFGTMAYFLERKGIAIARLE